MPHSPADPSQAVAAAPTQSVWQAIELPVRGIDLIEAVNRGLPCTPFLRLAIWLDIPPAVGRQCVGISPSTWRRRVVTGRLSVQESDRLYRFVSTLDLALQLFEGDKSTAYAWLCRPQRGLTNRCAIDLLATTAGTDAIRELIGRL